ncbi:MAG: hypothetical protein CM15mP126_7720 [Gammaproteobacteria bacterium]|nr:MAG: hypothetical protein CM15mP126_7720 [Gammaproteobacteria bacterium]
MHGLWYDKTRESNIGNNNPDRVLPSYTRIDFAQLSNFADDLSFTMNIENLTDTLYFPHSHSSHQHQLANHLT